jgi:hypothetical protein
MTDAKEDMLAVVTLSVKAAAMGSALIDSRRTVDELREQVFIGLRKIATLSRERDEARERLAQWVSWGDRMASGHPDAPMASLDHEVRAVIANRYGMSVITRNTQEDA